MAYDRVFIGAGLLCLMVGSAIGVWFGTPMGGDLALRPSHVHFNLLGWTTLALYGLIHKAYPEIGRGRLAPVHCCVAIAGAVLLPLGFGLPRDASAHVPVVAIGALASLTAPFLFGMMFWAASRSQPLPGAKHRERQTAKSTE